LQAQIALLMAQVNALQGRIAANAGGSGMPVWSCGFDRNLTVGSVGPDVRCLQQFLNARGHAVASAGAGSPGNETVSFGMRTRAALAKFQMAQGISPAAGYFGPITRAAIAAGR